MANLRLAQATVQAAGDAVVDLIDGGASGGTIDIYDGTQPANANTAVTSQVKLATVTFQATAFGATSTAGVATAATPLTDDTSAAATGTATWARVSDSNGVVIFDCDVSTSGATINLNSTSITTGGTVSVSSFTITVPSGV